MSPETKQNFSFNSLKISKSEELLKAYPLLVINFKRYEVTCLPAISSLSKLDVMTFPSNTGIQCVTPSPLSKSMAVISP